MALAKRNAAYRGTEALAALKAEAAATADLNAQIAAAQRGHSNLNGAMIRGVGSSKALTLAGLNLSRQFADIGVTAAMGMSPLMILIQQGPQIADAFQMAKAQGLGFSAVVKGLAVQMGLLKIVTPAVVADALALATAEQAAAAAALEAAVANRAKMAATAQAAQADAAAAVAANALAVANERVAVTATAAAAAETAALAPLALVVGAIVAIGATVFAGVALGARNLNKENKDLVASLGLTEKQLQHLKDKGVNTAVTMGDVFRGTGQFIAEQLTGPLKPVADFFSWMMDKITEYAVKGIKIYIGVYVGAFEAVKATWKMLPAAMGDLAISAANLTINAIEAMVNKAGDLVNGLIDKANAAAKALNLPVAIGRVGRVDFGNIDNPYAGQAAAAMQAGKTGFKTGMDAASGWVDGFLGAWGKSVLDATKDRLTKASGKPGNDPKRPAAPRDQTDERTAQIAALLAEAKAEELQAQLALTREIQARADLEKQILRQQALAKQAQVDRQIANVEDDKGLSASKKAELTAQLQVVKTINDRVEAAKLRAIDEASADALAKEALGRQVASRDLQIDVLTSQGAVAKFAYQRRDIDMKVLKLQQQIEKLKLEEIVASKLSTQAEKDIAAARLAMLGIIQGNQQTALGGGIDGAFNNVKSALDGMASAFKNRDWKGAVSGLMEALGSLKAAFGKGGTTQGKIGAVAGVADMIGQAIGGGFGGALSGAASGAMAGTMILPGIGTAIGGIVGGIAGFIGGSSAKKKAKEEAEAQRAAAAAQRAADILNQRRQIELNIIELSGDAVATLAAQRAKEMEGIDESNLALARQMYDLQDAKRRKDEKEALELRVMEALGDSTGILAIRRAAELKAIDATNRALLEYTFLQEDLAVKVADARAVLTEAYQREASALQATKDRFTALAGTIRDFIDGLSKSAGGAASYAIARRNFLSTASSAATGNPDAMGALPGLAQTFLDASRTSARTQLEYNRDIAVVKNALKAAEASAMHEAAAADQQLEALNASVAGLIAINSSVISVHDAIIGLNAALAAQAAAVTAFAAQQAATPPATPAPYSGGPNWESYLAKHPDVMAEYVSESTRDEKSKAYLASLGISSATQFAQWHWNTFGKAAGWENFATGGSFTVGGTGGPDSQNFGPINLSPGEVVNVRKGGDNDNGMSAVAEALQQQNDLLKEQNRLLKSLDTREGVRDFQGFYVRGEVPGEPVSTKEAA